MHKCIPFHSLFSAFFLVMRGFASSFFSFSLFRHDVRKKCGKNHNIKDKKFKLVKISMQIRQTCSSKCSAHSFRLFSLNEWQEKKNKKRGMNGGQSVSCWECEDGYDDDIFLMSLETSALRTWLLPPTTTNINKNVNSKSWWLGSNCSIKLHDEQFTLRLSHRRMCHKIFYSTTKID